MITRTKISVLLLAGPLMMYAQAPSNAEDLFRQAVQYEQGDGVSRNLAEARRLYMKAAELNYMPAMTNLGLSYTEGGDGLEVDHAKALDWFSKAAAGGSVVALANVGRMYTNGNGVPQDHAEALKWYYKAAEKGHDRSMFNIGTNYHEGLGVVRNTAQARYWYEKAADLGNADAMANLGLLYATGAPGTRQDHTMAYGWWVKAAEAGNNIAMYNLGYLYEQGIGVRKDLHEARGWYQKAVDAGHETAEESLNQLDWESKEITRSSNAHCDTNRPPIFNVKIGFTHRHFPSLPDEITYVYRSGYLVREITTFRRHFDDVQQIQQDSVAFDAARLDELQEYCLLHWLDYPWGEPCAHMAPIYAGVFYECGEVQARGGYYPCQTTGLPSEFVAMQGFLEAYFESEQQIPLAPLKTENK